MATYEPGLYMFKVTNQGFCESKKKGTPGFFLEGEPMALLVDGGEEACDNQYTRRIDMWITEATVERVTTDLQKLGWEGTKFKELDPSNPKVHSFFGNLIEVECLHEPGEGGKVYERWQLPFEGKSREPAVSDVKVASKLDALFGKTLSGRLRPASKAPAETVTTANDSDIPF